MAFTLGTAIATILTAFCGSLLASSALSQLSYILEIDLYRGVKLMQLIPIALFMLAYLLVYAYEETGAREAVLAHAGQRGEKNRVKRFNAYFGELMQTPMKLGWFLAIVVVAVAAVFMLLVFAYYMYRTGNSTTTSARELAFRNFLENTLIARPRTKEMIVGWPMLMLFIWSLRRRMRFLPMIFWGILSTSHRHSRGHCGGAHLPPCAQDLRGDEWLTFSISPLRLRQHRRRVHPARSSSSAARAHSRLLAHGALAQSLLHARKIRR